MCSYDPTSVFFTKFAKAFMLCCVFRRWKAEWCEFPELGIITPATRSSKDCGATLAKVRAASRRLLGSSALS